ncbi:MAG: PilZ-like domain-containing protein [Desulfuromonadales bacterium]
MSDVEQYATYFPRGLKITVCIPMDNNELFRDWAIVDALEEDIITLQLSRDELPVAVQLIAGTLLDLRVGNKGMGFRCSGYFDGELGSGKIIVRLSGNVSSSELREFFRIDVFLPFRYHVTEEQNLNILVGTWRKIKKIRLAAETDRREAFLEKHRKLLNRIAAGEFDSSDQEKRINKQLIEEEFYPIDETWDNVNANAINLSAGGFKFVTTDDLNVDDLVFIEMFIPATPPRIMDCVARITFKSRNFSFKNDEEHFNVAVQFVLIDDRDRDAIVSHISHLESLRIRQLRQLPTLDSESADTRISPFKLAVWITVSLIMFFIASSYFYEYSRQKINNEIQDIFQNAVRKYRETSGQK